MSANNNAIDISCRVPSRERAVRLIRDSINPGMRAYHNIALERIRYLRTRERVFDGAFRSMSPARARSR